MRNIFLLFCAFLLVSCYDDDSSDPNNNNDPNNPSGDIADLQAVNDFMLSSNGLRISLLTDDEDDETSDFQDFTFMFNDDDTVVATNNNQTVNGTYDVFVDDNRIELRMNFPSPPSFDELNDDWYYVAIDGTTIRFNDSGDRIEFTSN